MNKTPEPFTPKVILAIGAHADDIDFGASGSIAKWIAEGAEVHYLVITDGSKGSTADHITPDQLIPLRQQEQRAAAAVLGVKEVHFLDHEDARLEVTMELKKQIVWHIREVKPDTVVVMDPTMVYVADSGFINHPDHRAAGQATLDAVFPLARDHLSFPELFAAGLKPHKVEHLLLINLEKHNHFVDISNTLQTKLDALCKHASQFPDKEQVCGMITKRAEEMGRLAGCQYAETFVRLSISL